VDLPSGTVTFLFTDIEGSTRLAQAQAEAWPAILERHNRLLREAVEEEGGLQFGSEGDAIFAVFESAPRAVAAAVAAQRALAAEAWPDGVVVRVRMGLHSGEGTLSGEDYAGIDVHRVARITNAGHGGQVLLSAPTRMLTEASLPDGVALRDLGEHRLKDLSRPERMAMLVLDGLPASFPPLRTLDVVPNNLPTQLTTFLGRDRELSDAGRLLESSRLLTLTGPGGTGKTRLSLQLAADASDWFSDGVYFVPLGTIGEPALVLPTIAQALGLPDPGGRPLERLGEHLAGKRVLFVLDNFEQVIDAAPDIAELIARLPEAKVLATSRSPLRVYGEQEFPVPPLAIPDLRHLPDLDGISQFASVALFIERAMSVQPGFSVDASNAPAIAEICARLDGLPLAIELAAARVRVLTPQAIMARLGSTLSLLAGGSRDLPERQRTLRGAIDWSHDLLEEPDRVAFARFSVFAGGADVTAVERVVLPDWPAAAGPAPDSLDAVSSLLDKSLLRQEMAVNGEPRFRMLETIREYAAERLAAREPDDATRLRHAEHYLSLAEDASQRLFGPDQGTCLDKLDRDHDNLRGAIGFALDTGRAELAMRLLSAAWRFWQMRGYLPEARDKSERILALPTSKAAAATRLRALDAGGGIAYWQGDMDAARSWYQAERALAAELGDATAEAEATYNQSMTYALTREGAMDAQRLSRDALAQFEALGNRHGVGRALWALVNGMAYDSEDRTNAGGLADQSVGIFREVGDRFMLAWALYTRGLIHIQASEFEAARAALRESIEIFSATGDVSGYALVLDGFAAIEWLAGDRDRAMRIAGAASAIQDVSGVGLAQRNREYAQFFPQDLLSEAPLAEAYAAGKQLSTEQGIALALQQDSASVAGRR
jgi:predicted ATPase/class 3 adenylate cyclase